MKVFNKKNVVAGILSKYTPKSFEERYLFFYFVSKWILPSLALVGSAWFSFSFWESTGLTDGNLYGSIFITSFVSVLIFIFSTQALKDHIAYEEMSIFTIFTVLLCGFNVYTDIQGSKDIVLNRIEEPKDDKSNILIQSFQSTKETLESNVNRLDSLAQIDAWSAASDLSGKWGKIRERHELNLAQRDSAQNTLNALIYEHQATLSTSMKEHSDNIVSYKSEVKEKTLRFTAGATICTIIFLSSFLFTAYYDGKVKSLYTQEEKEEETPATTPPTPGKKKPSLEVVKDEAHDGKTSKKDVIFTFLDNHQNALLEDIAFHCDCSTATARKWRKRYYSNSNKFINYA